MSRLQGIRRLARGNQEAVGANGTEELSLRLYGGEADDSFVKRLQLVVETLGLDIGDLSVLYPGSSTHIGVASVFGKEHVTHVDIDPDATRLLQEEGYASVLGAVEQLVAPEKYDVFVSYNSGTVNKEELERLLNPGGLIIANNWHGSANELFEQSGCELIGVVYIDEAGNAKASNQHTAKTMIGTMVVDEFETPLFPDELFIFQQVI